MSDAANLHLSDMEQQIVGLMQQQPTGAITLAGIVEQTGAPEGKVRAALAKLERINVVDRGHALDGAEEYIFNPAVAAQYLS